MDRVLAIDYGEKKIGLAVGDTKEYIIAPYEVISSGSFESTIVPIADIIFEPGSGAVDGGP